MKEMHERMIFLNNLGHEMGGKYEDLGMFFLIIMIRFPDFELFSDFFGGLCKLLLIFIVFLGLFSYFYPTSYRLFLF